MVCAKCGVQFGMGRTGVIIQFFRKDGSAYFRRGDESVCPVCGHVVLGSFGEPYQGEKREPSHTVKS